MATQTGTGKAINDYLNHYVLVSDGKAALTATAALAVIGFALGDPAKDAVPWLRWLGIGVAGLSVLLAGTVLFPRTPSSGNGHLFWGDIRGHGSATDYFNSLSNVTVDGLEFEYARQNFNVAGVLNCKIRKLRYAIVALCAASISILLAFGVK